MNLKKEFLILIFALTLSGCASKTPNVNTVDLPQNPAQSESITEIKASFLIFTNGTKRDFSDSRYHNLNPDIYLDSSKPTTVVVKDENLTWQDLFNTLPMKLTPECLTTGTGQNFCTNTTNSLKFFINGEPTPDALSQKIKNGDKLLVSYGSEVLQSNTIQGQINQIPNP